MFSRKYNSMILERKQYDIKIVMEYASMSNGQAERMVFSIKKSVAETISKEQQVWTTSIRPVPYEY